MTPYPQMNGKWQITTEGIEYAPIWDPSGESLYYAANQRFMKVKVSQGPLSFSPQEIVRLPESLVLIHDISRDGKKFLVTMAEQSDTKATELTIVVNWFTELCQEFLSLKK